MGAHPFEAQDEKTALEGLMERARKAHVEPRCNVWLNACHVYPLSAEKVPSNLIAYSSAFHNALASPSVSDLWSELSKRVEVVHFNCHGDTGESEITLNCFKWEVPDLLGPNGIEWDYKPLQARRGTDTSMLAKWAAEYAKTLARRRRFRTDVVSPAKFLAKLLSELGQKVPQWNYQIATDGLVPATSNEHLAALVYAMLHAVAPPKKRIFFILDAYRRDLLATTSSFALAASRSREIVPTRSVTPRSARPTTRHLCVIRRRPTVDRALRRARLRATPLAAPAPHAAARASETRTLSTLSGRSPRRRLLDRGGTRRALAA